MQTEVNHVLRQINSDFILYAVLWQLYFLLLRFQLKIVVHADQNHHNKEEDNSQEQETGVLIEPTHFFPRLFLHGFDLKSNVYFFWIVEGITWVVFLIVYPLKVALIESDCFYVCVVFELLLVFCEDSEILQVDEGQSEISLFSLQHCPSVLVYLVFVESWIVVVVKVI